jgi:hypothetical protein
VCVAYFLSQAWHWDIASAPAVPLHDCAGAFLCASPRSCGSQKMRSFFLLFSCGTTVRKSKK